MVLLVATSVKYRPEDAFLFSAVTPRLNSERLLSRA